MAGLPHGKGQIMGILAAVLWWAFRLVATLMILAGLGFVGEWTDQRLIEGIVGAVLLVGGLVLVALGGIADRLDGIRRRLAGVGALGGPDRPQTAAGGLADADRQAPAGVGQTGADKKAAARVKEDASALARLWSGGSHGAG